LMLIATVLVWGAGLGMLVALGPEPGRAGMTGMMLLLISADHALAFNEAVGLAGLVFAGGVIQMVLSIIAWPLHRHRPERDALASVFRMLQSVAAEPGRADSPPPATMELQQTRLVLLGMHRSRDMTAQSFRVLVDIAERLRIQLLAICDLHEQAQATEARRAGRALLDRTASVLGTLAMAVDSGKPSPSTSAALIEVEASIAALRMQELRSLSGHDAALLFMIAARADRLAGSLRSAIRNVAHANHRGKPHGNREPETSPAALQAEHSIATLRANLSLSSSALRHAIRCAIGLALAVAIARYGQLAHGYWLPMTVAIVLKPDFASTFNVGVLRVGGTLIGLAASTLLVQHLLGNSMALLAMFAMLCFCFRIVTTMHYALGVAALTGLIVILLAWYGISPGETMLPRGLATTIGAVLALAIYAVWPSWETDRVRPALAEMIDGYRRYFDAVLRGTSLQRDAARSDGRGLRVNARASLDRLHAEPRVDHTLLELGEAIFSNGNRLSRASMNLEAILNDADNLPQRDHVQAYARQVDHALLSISESIRSGTAPPPNELRAEERRLHRALDADRGDAQAEIAAVLAHACDRMTDTIDTLTHLLETPGVAPVASPIQPLGTGT
ncbi:MAG: FUSC family protein, partial [Dokdonella sp.]